MLKHCRALTASALLILSLVIFSIGLQPSVLAQEIPAQAVSIDGDHATRIATSSPDATAQAVAGDTDFYRRDAGQDWMRTGEAPGEGVVVFAADDPDLALTGDHPPCLRGGEATALTRTEDGGVNWTAVDGATQIRPLAVWAETGVAIGSSCAGFMLSTDRGLTWSGIDAVEPGFEITAFAVVGEPTGTSGPVILFGETSEGGSSRLRTVDLTDPSGPIVSGVLREYYGVAGLAGRGDSFAVAAIDGVWASVDAGHTWTRTADGLDAVVLAEDPAVAGLPANVAMDEIGLFAIVFLPGTEGGLAVGSAAGLYLSQSAGAVWVAAGGIAARVDQVVVAEGDNRLLLRSNDTVLEITLDG